MARRMIGGLVAAIGVALAGVIPGVAHAQTQQQELVDRATLTVQDMVADSRPDAEIRKLVQRARGLMICPRIFKAGFIIGGQGGDCVLVGHTGPAAWSDPAFYTLGSASIGLQAGIQDTQLVLIVLTERGVRALLDTQLKLGADASLAFATLGLGVGGATSTALNADIVTFQINRGLFAGLSLDGAILGARSDYNQAYYGQPAAAQQIVYGQQLHNPGADPLKEMINKLGSAPAEVPAPFLGASPGSQQQSYQQPYAQQPYAQQSGQYGASGYAQAPTQQYSGAPQYGASASGGPTPLAQGAGGSIQTAPLPPPR